MTASLRLHEITMDCSDALATASFWSQLLAAPLREPLPGWRRLGPLNDGGPVLNFQPVPEPKQGKSRVHLDFTTDDLPTAVRRVVQLGGRDTGERHQYDEGTVAVVADPEGHEFCLVQHATQQSGE